MTTKQTGRDRWERYLDAPLEEHKLVQRDRADAFEAQSRRIEELVRRLRPSRIACMGSGFLNDLPVQAMFEVADETYLIDWLPNISLQGLRRRIIQQSDGASRCIFCECNAPERFCRSFSETDRDPAHLCNAFRQPEDSHVQCANYKPAEEPKFVHADVTSGRASQFGQRIFNIVGHSDSPKQAFSRAIRECRRCESMEDPVPVSSDSFDFVTSSLVASQFEVEPYEYFASLIEEKFGREAIESKAHLLNPLMEQLRDELFRVLIEGHCAEIHRMLDKEVGRAYLSVELFRSVPEGDGYFLVHESPQLLEALGRYFFFDFESLPAEDASRSHPMGNASSIIYSFVLRPRSSGTLSAA